MGAASIRIDQPTHPTVPVGQPGRARDDLILGDPVIARNSNDTDVQRWAWALIDKPAGSAAALSAITSPSVTFTPDVEGSYLLQLAVDDALEGQVDLKVAAVRDSLGHRYPATGETLASTNWPGNDSKGWGKDAEQILRGLHVPQLSGGIMPETAPVAASTVIVIGGIGLPTSLAQIVDYGFVDAAASVGAVPVVNSFGFATTTGTGGKELQLLTIDFDTTASVAGDSWAMVIGLAEVGDLFATILTIV